MATILDANRLDAAKPVGSALSFEGTVKQGASLVNISTWGLVLKGNYSDDAPSLAARVSLAVGTGITLGTTGKFTVTIPTVGLVPGKVLEWSLAAPGDSDAPVLVKGSLSLTEAAG
jgi:hypothetical protein